MSKCEYYYKYANGESEQCGEDSLSGDDKCIFHSSNENKDPGMFKAAFQKKDPVEEVFDFSGYVFPVQVEHNMFPLEAIEGESSTLTFNKKMIFKQASFLKGITFSNMIFNESIDMSECRFYGECYFNKSEFNGKVILDKSIVQNELNFDESKFLAGISWDNDSLTVKASEGEIIFTKIKVRNSEQINFSYVDLSHWSFLGSDISRINFKFCKWANGSNREKCHGRSKSTYMLYDELNKKWNYKPFRSMCLHFIKVDSKDSRSTGDGYDEILSLYRGLRMNYENKLQYQEAGAFHIGEMEARRLSLLQNNKRKTIPSFEYFVMWLYKFLSDYGENYLKVSGRFIVIVAVFAILFMFAGLQKVHDNFNISKKNIDYSLSLQVPSTNNIKELFVDFARSIAYSFSVATIFLKDRQYIYKNESGYYLFILESCFGVIILPLLVLAVRRNFKRSTKEKIYG